MMRKHDPQVREDGFGLVRQVAPEHVADLVTAYSREEDHGLGCWLLELIGEARSPEALPVLSEALASQDESIRDWARIGLEKLGTKEARTLLWRQQQ
jgi:HEAT repeat protein